MVEALSKRPDPRVSQIESARPSNVEARGSAAELDTDPLRPLLSSLGTLSGMAVYLARGVWHLQTDYVTVP
jgi:hypothetical protein